MPKVADTTAGVYELSNDPPPPPAGTMQVYGKTDKGYYVQDSDGLVTKMGPLAPAGSTASPLTVTATYSVPVASQVVMRTLAIGPAAELIIPADSEVIFV